MTSKDEALSVVDTLKLALEALEWINRVSAMDYEYQQKARESLNAIYEALAEQPAQHQEPAAWVGEIAEEAELMLEKPRFRAVALYTSPPASKPWVGLTDEDIRPMCKQDWVFDTVKQWAQIIEAKLKEKNDF